MSRVYYAPAGTPSPSWDALAAYVIIHGDGSPHQPMGVINAASAPKPLVEIVGKPPHAGRMSRNARIMTGICQGVL